MRRAPVLAAALLAAAGCAGRVPQQNIAQEAGISAILMGARLILPSGETRNGELEVGFESDGGSGREIYRLSLKGGEFYLYLIEPGFYRLAPTRTWLGAYRPDMHATIEGRSYRLPFPRELLRTSSLEVKPRKIVTLGIIEAKVQAALPGQKGTLKVRVDDSVQARRQVVQTLIREMLDPRRSSSEQASAMAWSRALQNALMDLLAEEEPRPMFKPAP